MNVVNQSEDLLAHAPLCAYCLWRFTREVNEDITMCPSCATPYHTECFQENGGCATFGCALWASAEETTFAPPPPPPPPSGAGFVALESVGSVSQQFATPNTQGPNFCSQCGNPLEEGYAFCSNCGTRVAS
jgi:predicted amidophosphoribosyltransferase